ncbi:HAD family hydrolase [Candidatus Bipolaricaulota bacterium]|nr:HAD family hydrolase [Candidatus Bipolaricaulota bacterium]
MGRTRMALVGVDADDTLWHNEIVYRRAEGMFCDLLGVSTKADIRTLRRHLLATETANVPLYGYGIKSFVLSMIETAAVRLHDLMNAERVRGILGIARWMIDQEVTLMDGVAPALRKLHKEHALVLITKGDLLDQRRKLARSGIADSFEGVEIVSEKDERIYGEILLRYGVSPQAFVMIGNSLKSDILPVVAIGGTGIHVPYPDEWEHEVLPRAESRGISDRWMIAERFDQVPSLLDSIEAQHC